MACSPFCFFDLIVFPPFVCVCLCFLLFALKSEAKQESAFCVYLPSTFFSLLFTAEICFSLAFRVLLPLSLRLGLLLLNAVLVFVSMFIITTTTTTRFLAAALSVRKLS